jgi:uncharacterized repeat protein (TIGR03803 family)
MKRAMLVLSASLLALWGTNSAAQTLSTVYSFTNGTDGSTPYAGLTVVGNTLYGTARDGGSAGKGTVFKVSIDGTGFTTLYSFSDSVGDDPYAGLVLLSDTLFGTTSYGGDGYGTVFTLGTDGAGFTTVYSFSSTGSDGAYTHSGLVLAGGTLYGTTPEQGSGLEGTVFKVNMNGTGFSVLHGFTPLSWSGSANTNGDGGWPEAGLLLSGNTLYGTACYGGGGGNGVVFQVNTDGTGFAALHSFTSEGVFISSDGANPVAPLSLSGNTLYGTTRSGGSADYGTVFKLNTEGTGFTTLHSFSGGGDGAYPEAGLVLSGNTLYGTTSGGGGDYEGTVFKVNVNGTGFGALHSFSGGSDGGFPDAGLVLSGDTLYGTTTLGGSAGHGTVFALKLPASRPIPLDAQPTPNALVLSWTNSSFWLESAAMPTGVYTNVPGATSPYTNAFSGPQRFFRLQAD